MRRVVVFCLIDERQRVLLEQKAYDHPNEPGCLVFPGGVVEFRESALDAIRREMREEYGINDTELTFKKLFDDREYDSPGGHRFHVSYYVVLGWDGEYSKVSGAEPSELYEFDKAYNLLNTRRKFVLRMAREELLRRSEAF